MKFFQVIIILIIISLVFVSCNKTSDTLTASASLNIINAINLSNPIVTDFTPLAPKGGTESPLLYYYLANQIGYASYYELGYYVGETALTISQIDDTAKLIWQGMFNLPLGSIHSIFFAGDTTRVDTLFTTDNIPYYLPGDSVSGVRFVNLAENAQPVLVTIQTDTTHTPIAKNIAYKSLTEFQQIPANANALNTGYTFEFRDAASDSILTTVSVNNNGYPGLFPGKSITICLIGQEGSNATVPLAGMICPNY
jgi:hypothetical protein